MVEKPQAPGNLSVETARAGRAGQRCGRRDGEGFPARHVLIFVGKEIAGTFSKGLFMCGFFSVGCLVVFLLRVPASRCQQPVSAAVPPLVPTGAPGVPAPAPV